MTNPLVPRVGVSSLSSPLEVGADRAPKAADDLARLLERNGCEVVLLGPVGTADAAIEAGRQAAEARVDAFALASACWFEDYLVLDLLEERLAPVLLWALPGMETGALCGTQQLTCYLKQLDWPFDVVYGELRQGDGLDRATTFLRAATLKSRLRRARIGLAGQRIGGMTHTSPNEFMLKKSIGARVVPLDLPKLLERARGMPEQAARELWGQLKRKVGACRVEDEDGLDSMRVYAAVKELVAEHGLSALTIGCYPHLMGRVCLAASLLADEGVPLACEGDVNGAVGQLMLTLLTGAPTHNTDWLDPLPDGTVVFTHCGSGSFELAEDKKEIRLDSVRLMGQGACALFPAKTGPVTLISLLACPAGYQCAVLEGEALSAEMVFPGNPLRVGFSRPTTELIDWIAREGIGHHWMAGYGHMAAELRAWAGIVGPAIRLVEP